MRDKYDRVGTPTYRGNWEGIGRSAWKVAASLFLLVGGTLLVSIIQTLTGSATVALCTVAIMAGAMIVITRLYPALSFAGLGSKGVRIVSIVLCAFFGLGALGSILPKPAKRISTAGQPQSAPAAVAGPVLTPSPKSSLRKLPPASRFLEFSQTDPYRHAQDLLNAGSVEEAYNLFEGRNRNGDGPREKRFDAVLEQAFQKSARTTPGSDFAERVNTYWLPQARAISTKPPTEAEGWHAVLLSLNELAADASMADAIKLTREQRIAETKLLAVLGEKQAILYPALRLHVQSGLNEKLFRDDTSVSTSGAGQRTIEFVSVRFAANANVADFEEQIEPSLLQARFRKVNYRWARGLPGLAYSLEPPSDKTVAVWNEMKSKFEPVHLNK